ncbi:MAG TPA: hypothetical protein VGR31_16770 [Planctomycetota bacterium]|jgi:hypothetical protein|nr:hypothetical protein [Planctomycetota bacterium]
MDESAPAPRRFRGLVVMAALVAVGLAVSAGYFIWSLTSDASEARRIVQERKREIAATPKTPEGRLAKWLEFGAPQIHHRLQMMRFSAEEPWLVTHAVRMDPEDPGRLSIHGIDFADLPVAIAQIEGSKVVVHLPRPKELGVGPLRGDNAAFVPIAPRDDLAPDPEQRATFLVQFALKDLFQALARDIPGAELAIRIGPEWSWAEIAAHSAAK